MKLTIEILVLGLVVTAWTKFQQSNVNESPSNLYSERAELTIQGDDPVWAAFEISELGAKREASGRPWLPFLDVSTLSAGLYVLPAEGTDRQQPHDEDEVYYIISGKASIQVEGEERAVGPGSVIYVKAEKDHRFVNISETLEVLVFFSAAEPS